MRDGLQRLGGGLQGHGAFWSDDSADGTRLMTTVRPWMVSRARKASPSAPAPMRSINSYDPSATGACAPADSGEGSVTSLTSWAAATA
jgi:hypothetical protein